MSDGSINIIASGGVSPILIYGMMDKYLNNFAFPAGTFSVILLMQMDVMLYFSYYF